MRISIIVAVAENGVIGRGGKLPWHLAADLRRFKRLTMGHAIVMGRKTWESIGRPLAGRRMMVVSRDPHYRSEFDDVAVVRNVDAAVELAKAAGEVEVFIIGGSDIFRCGLPLADAIYLTRVEAEIDGDAFFPEIDWTAWQLRQSEVHDADAQNDFRHVFQMFERVASEPRTASIDFVKKGR